MLECHGEPGHRGHTDLITVSLSQRSEGSHTKTLDGGLSMTYILKSFLPPFLTRQKESRHRSRKASFRLSQWSIVQAHTDCGHEVERKN